MDVNGLKIGDRIRCKTEENNEYIARIIARPSEHYLIIQKTDEKYYLYSIHKNFVVSKLEPFSQQYKEIPIEHGYVAYCEKCKRTKIIPQKLIPDDIYICADCKNNETIRVSNLKIGDKIKFCSCTTKMQIGVIINLFNGIFNVEWGDYSCKLQEIIDADRIIFKLEPHREIPIEQINIKSKLNELKQELKIILDKVPNANSYESAYYVEQTKGIVDKICNLSEQKEERKPGSFKFNVVIMALHTISHSYHEDWNFAADGTAMINDLSYSIYKLPIPRGADIGKTYTVEITEKL